MKDPASAEVATLLGDLVASRHHPDRRALHRHLVTMLDAVNAMVPAVQATAVTVGDEVQGTYASVGLALDAAFRLRVAMLPQADIRCGVGWGAVTVLDPVTNIQDGPGWWAAREAVEVAEMDAASPMLRSVRTAYRRAGAGGPPEPAIRAALVCRDHLLGSLDERSLTILRGLMAGRTQKDIAAELDISPSAVSQRIRTAGIGPVLAAHEALRAVT